METNNAELALTGRERPVADVRGLKRKFRHKKKQKRRGQTFDLEIHSAVHGAKVGR